MGPQELVHTPDVRNPEKYPDCRTDLIGGGGNTDVRHGRQTPSRRHCLSGNTSLYLPPFLVICVLFALLYTHCAKNFCLLFCFFLRSF